MLPSQDRVAHMTSGDGLTWQAEDDALDSLSAGSCDRDMLWTAHTVEDPATGRFRMYFATCSQTGQGQIQQIAMAAADGLEAFQNHNANPVLEAASPYYESDLIENGFVSFRDPFVYVDREGGWHMLVTARDAEGPRFRRGCIAHATSPDGENWTLQPPLYAPGLYEDLEAPALLELEGRYYLFFHDFAGSTLYRMADSLEGPWTAPARDQPLPAGNIVWRFVRWDGDLLLFHWLSPSTPVSADADSPGGFVPAPKRVEVLADGSLALRPCLKSWSKYCDGSDVTANPKILAGESPGWRVKGKWLTADTTGSNQAVLPDRAEHFILNCKLRLDEGHALGVIFRSDEDLETINVLRLDYTSQTVELHEHVVFDSGSNRYRLSKKLVQRAHLPAVAYGKTLSLRLLACGRYVEVSVDDEVVLSAAMSAAAGDGVLTFVEDGRGSFADLNMQRLKEPSSR